MFANRPQQGLNWSHLPKEIQLLIVSVMYTTDGYQFSQTSKANHSLFNNELVWKQYYQKEFSNLDFQKNIKLQYVTAHFYKIIDECKRMDKAQIYYQKFLTFLENHKNEAWAIYYYGMMEYQGQGMVRSSRQAMGQLKKSYALNDSRTALFFAKLLLQANRKERSLLYGRFGELIINSLLSRLIDIYNQGSFPTAGYIAHFYQRGICVQANEQEADKWFEKLMSYDYESGIEEYCSAKIYAIERLKKKKLMQNLKLFLRDQVNAKPHSPAINFYLASMPYYFSENPEEVIDIEKLQLACDAHYLPALLFLADLYIQAAKKETAEVVRQDFNRFAIQLLERCFHAGYRNADKLLYSLVPHGLPFYKAHLLEGNLSSADYVAKYYSEILLQNLVPSDIVWLQLAAQHGSGLALDILSDLCQDDNPYANFAMFVLYSNGILYSYRIPPDKGMADYYLDMAVDLDRNIAAQYLDIAQTENPLLLCTEIAEKLENLTLSFSYCIATR